MSKFILTCNNKGLFNFVNRFHVSSVSRTALVELIIGVGLEDSLRLFIIGTEIIKFDELHPVFSSWVDSNYSNPHVSDSVKSYFETAKVYKEAGPAGEEKLAQLTQDFCKMHKDALSKFDCEIPSSILEEVKTDVDLFRELEGFDNGFKATHQAFNSFSAGELFEAEDSDRRSSATLKASSTLTEGNNRTTVAKKD